MFQGQARARPLFISSSPVEVTTWDMGVPFVRAYCTEIEGQGLDWGAANAITSWMESKGRKETGENYLRINVDLLCLLSLDWKRWSNLSAETSKHEQFVGFLSLSLSLIIRSNDQCSISYDNMAYIRHVLLNSHTQQLLYWGQETIDHKTGSLYHSWDVKLINLPFLRCITKKRDVKLTTRAEKSSFDLRLWTLYSNLVRCDVIW